MSDFSITLINRHEEIAPLYNAVEYLVDNYLDDTQVVVMGWLSEDKYLSIRADFPAVLYVPCPEVLSEDTTLTFPAIQLDSTNDIAWTWGSFHDPYNGTDVCNPQTAGFGGLHAIYQGKNLSEQGLAVQDGIIHVLEVSDGRYIKSVIDINKTARLTD